ncbi:hypothetical protein Pmani_022277 [Petrolisthes manimaculis]|uniref:Uncharacterized protein n=1 Tax=Petrolisthes manimaculis TaxID=1843537 RepID=A0AAE1PCF6_9EUCA|nr:hypothetical protein Pmani_022277 [Petrolisthes manimaculis]
MARGVLVWTLAAVALLSLTIVETSSSSSATDTMDDGSADNCSSYTPHSRQKRLLYFTPDRRLTLPPDSILILTPTLSLPFGRNLPLGYSSSMTISVPFKIDFATLGLTSDLNPFGILPPIWDFFRRKRSADHPSINWSGGDREMMYQVAEDTLHNMGMDGQGCLLRAICEIFQMPLANHGFFGEVLELFLSPSRAPYAQKRLPLYLEAERVGRTNGDCSQYVPLCAHSLFTNPGSSVWTEAEENMDRYADDSDDTDPQDTVDAEGMSEQGSQSASSKDKPNMNPKKASKDSKKSLGGCKNRPR